MARANRHHIPGYMVRVGVVKHPSEWEAGGFNEIQNPPARYGVIDRHGLHKFCGIPECESFAEHHRHWVQDALGQGLGSGLEK